MSVYKDELDFLRRTKEIFQEKKVKNNKSFFLNCCVGILIMPQQYNNRSATKINLGTVNKEDLGIDISQCKYNTPKSGTAPDSVENIAYHFRNSICHYRFDVMSCNKGKTMENIIIRDKNGENGPDTFELKLTFDDFEKFVNKYSDELINKLGS